MGSGERECEVERLLLTSESLTAGVPLFCSVSALQSLQNHNHRVWVKLHTDISESVTKEKEGVLQVKRSDGFKYKLVGMLH